MQSRSAKHATDGSTSHRFFTRFPKPRTSRKRRQGPILETLETRTLLSITASLNTATQVLTFNQATSNDQLTLYETDVDNSGTIDGFAAVYDDGIAPPAQQPVTNTWSFAQVSNIVVDLSGHAGTTLTVSNLNGAPWSFTEPISYTGNGASSTLETQGVDTTWTLAHLSSNLIGTVNSPTPTANPISFSGVGTLTADPNQNNTLVGDNVASTWTLTDSANDGTYSDGPNTVSFSGFNTLTAGSSTDNILIGENAYSYWSLTAGSSTYSDASYSTVSFSGFDTLQGGNAGNWFDVSTTFDGSLYGGGVSTGLDTNTFNLWGGGVIEGSLYGGANNDTDINLLGGSVTGGIHGEISQESGLATISYSAAVTVTVTGHDSYGYSGTDGLTGGGFTGINMVVAQTAGSTLTGDNSTSTWTLDPSVGTYVDNSASPLLFAGFDTLQGGTGDNTFEVNTTFDGTLNGGGVSTSSPGTAIFDLNTDGSVTGGINGQSGDSTISYSGAVDVIVSGIDSADPPIGYSGNEAASVSGGFTGINEVTGVGGSLTGDNLASTWAIDTTNTYKDLTTGNSLVLKFSGFDTLQGGTGNNTFEVNTTFDGTLNGGGVSTTSPGTAIFDLNTDGSVTGGINGQSGDSTINYSAAVDVIVSGLDSADPPIGYSGNEAASVSGGFTGINEVTAVGGSLTGDNLASTWTIDTTNTYKDLTTGNSLVLKFSGFDILQGGTGNNTFEVNTTFDGTLNGGGVSTSSPGTAIFDLNTDGSVTGGINGQSGDSTISYSGAVDVIVSGIDSADPPIGYSGNEATSVSGGFTGINEVIAIGGSLTGDNLASTWTIDTTNTYKDLTTGNSLVLKFSGFDTLQGGTGNNTFEVNTTFDGTLNGGGVSTTSPGTAIFDLNTDGSVTGGINGQSGDSTINYSGAVDVIVSGIDSADPPIGYSGHEATSVSGGFTGINEVTAANTGSTLTGDNNASQWTIVGPPNFYQDVTLGNTLSLGFSGFTNLQGGTGNNTFTVFEFKTFAGSFHGGSEGIDTFNLSLGARVTGGIYGESGDSTINYSAAVDVTVSGLDSADPPIGYSGNEAPSVSGGFTGINEVTAVGGSLTGDNLASTWTIDTTNTYKDLTTGNSLVLKFSGFDTLQGGTGNNTFEVNTAFDGTLNGGGVGNPAGTAVFDLNAGGSVSNGDSPGIVGQSGASTINYSAAVDVTVSGLDSADPHIGYNGTDALTSGGGSVSGGFTGINTVNDTGTTNTLTGDDNASTWTLAGNTMAYQDNAATLPLSFSGFGTLQGGSGADTFIITETVSSSLNLKGGYGANDFVFGATGVTLNGTIDGQTGTNTIDYSADGSAVTVNLGTAMSTGTLGISNIESLVGGTNTTLVGPNAATTTTWTISGVNSGSLSSGFTFSAVKNLSGGIRTNIFALGDGASVSGAISGGSTNDTLNLSASNAAAAVNITGNNLGNVSIGGSTVASFSRIANIVGTTGDDTFALSNGKALTGTLTGPAGNDTLDYSAYTTSVRVNLTTGAATSIDDGRASGITGVENVTGGSGSDILIGDANANVLRDGNGNDVIVGGGGDDTIYGGRGYDIIITGGTTAAATVYGDGGQDLTIGGSYTQQANLAALNSLMAEWSRTGESLSTKISHLNGTVRGGLNGEFFLNASTVQTDSAIEALYGGDGSTIPSSGENWFLASSTGKVKDKTGDDVVTVLNS